MHKFSLSAVILLGLSACASSGSGQYSDGVAENTPVGDNEVVCTREVQSFSHMKKKVCRTKAQIVAEHEATQEALREMERRTVTAPVVTQTTQ
jgi:hypothetical protein